ncbi:alpha-2,8-sialyltransferase 8F [Mugil cephalus]|uniref:alpha-2,8-sialyltransferase 8F n=1 Tax=Mugil cephalus TaxID=48193 RepID=UPI001FB65FD6|nr:alpha-2,8-sialyltransferase 8F [Mugil cephalus]
MRGQPLKTLFYFLITLLFLGSVLTTLIWYILDTNHVEPRQTPQKKRTPPAAVPCKGCREVVEKIMKGYSNTWKKQEDNYSKFRYELNLKCNGFNKAIITQMNTPVGSKLVYDGEKKRTLKVTPEIFSTFTKDHPSSNKTWKTCAVVGNGGILTNSSCGKRIDSAEFVMRCNLPPLQNGYEEHVGVKTNLVTANPSIMLDKYGGLMGRRRAFVEGLRTYGNSMLLLPAFSYGHNTPVSLRALYTVEDFNSPIRPMFFNPEYLGNLARFWRSMGLKAARLSTGIIMASFALEFCSEVNLYGFWPFSTHPHDFRALTNHYYDDRQTKVKFHAMPVEFSLLVKLHNEGVLRLHLGDCEP